MSAGGGVGSQGRVRGGWCVSFAVQAGRAGCGQGLLQGLWAAGSVRACAQMPAAAVPTSWPPAALANEAAAR